MTRRLSVEQQAAHDELVAYARGKDTRHKMKLLEGYAGTGKTTTITEVVKTLRADSRQGDIFDSSPVRRLRIAATAPTHKAVRVMRKFSEFAPEDVEYTTIHSLLGLREEIDDRGGKARVKYVQSNDPNAVRIESFDVVLLDEASMLSDELFDLLQPYVLRGKKIIFIGDPVQIPPVGHPDSKPFLPAMQTKYSIGVIKLTSIMRQAEGNPILRYATTIRQEYRTAWSFPLTTDRSIGPPPRGIIRIDEDETARAIMKEYFDCQEFRDNADYMKIIAYRNSVVNGFNAEVRKLIFPMPDGQDVPYLMEREKLIIDKPVILPSGRILLSTNEEVEVESFRERTADCEYQTALKQDEVWMLTLEETPFKYYDTEVAYYNWKSERIKVNIRILHESEEQRFWNIVNEISYAAQNQPFKSPLRNKLWVSYFKMQKLFAQVKYNYAITGHKSQGSTYDNAMVIDWDIDKNSNLVERNRIKYVAMTRARHQLFIVK